MGFLDFLFDQTVQQSIPVFGQKRLNAFVSYTIIPFESVYKLECFWI